jgi:hypothetical protein
VRNLNNVDVGGRPLRIDLADSDPFLEGKTTVRGELVDSGESRAQWRERERDDFRSGPLKSPPDPNAFMAGLSAGVPIPPGSTSLDTISNTLGTMNPSQLIEVLAQMKVRLTCISTCPLPQPCGYTGICDHTSRTGTDLVDHPSTTSVRIVPSIVTQQNR